MSSIARMCPSQAGEPPIPIVGTASAAVSSRRGSRRALDDRDLRFTLSFPSVEDLLAERGLDGSCETARRWVLNRSCDSVRRSSGPSFAVSHLVASSASARKPGGIAGAELTCRAPVNREIELGSLLDGRPPVDSFGVDWDRSHRPDRIVVMPPERPLPWGTARRRTTRRRVRQPRQRSLRLPTP